MNLSSLDSFASGASSIGQGIAAVGDIFSSVIQARVDRTLAKARQSAAKHQGWLQSANAALADLDLDRDLAALGVQHANNIGTLKAQQAASNVQLHGVEDAATFAYDDARIAIKRKSNMAGRTAVASSKSNILSAGLIDTSFNPTNILAGIQRGADTYAKKSMLYKLQKNTGRQSNNILGNFGL